MFRHTGDLIDVLAPLDCCNLDSPHYKTVVCVSLHVIHTHIHTFFAFLCKDKRLTSMNKLNELDVRNYLHSQDYRSAIPGSTLNSVQVHALILDPSKWNHHGGIEL